MSAVGQSHRSAAFTIIELIITILLIGMLAVVVSMGFDGVSKIARDNQRNVNIKSLAESLEIYYSKNGEYPGCPTMTSPNLNTLSSTLNNLSLKSFTMPKYDSNSNALICSDYGTDEIRDVIAYRSEQSSNCQTGNSCMFFVLKYREESTGKIISVNSKNYHGTPVMASCEANQITNYSAVLCTNIVDSGDGDIENSGICWGIEQSKINNCTGIFENGVTNNGSYDIGNPYTSIVVSKDNKYVYATVGYYGFTGLLSARGGYIAAYERDSEGVLTLLNTYDTGNPQTSIAISPDGKNIYATSGYYGYTGLLSARGGYVSAYSRDQNSGALTLINTYNSGDPFTEITVSPDGKNVYATSGYYGYTGTLTERGGYVVAYSRDTSNGGLSAIASYLSGNPYTSIAVSPDNKSVYATSGYYGYTGLLSARGGYVVLFNRNLSSGALSYVNSYDSGNPYNSIVVSNDGKNVYGAVGYYGFTGTLSARGGYVANYSRSSVDGSLVLVNNYNNGDPYNSITISPDGKSIFAAVGYYGYTGLLSARGGYLVEYNRDQSSGSLNYINNYNSGDPYNFVTVSSDGKNVYTAIGFYGFTGTLSARGGYLVGYKRTNMTSIGTITQLFSGLPTGTRIYFRGFSNNNIGKEYSKTNVFTTL